MCEHNGDGQTLLAQPSQFADQSVISQDSTFTYMQGGSQDKPSQDCKGQSCHLQALSGLQIPGHLQHQMFNSDLAFTQHVKYMHLVLQQASPG